MIDALSHLSCEGRIERIGGLGQSQCRTGADRPVPIEQGRSASCHTGCAVVALGCQPEVFTVRQSARSDRVVSVDIAQSASAPMGERTCDITDECQSSKWC